MSKDEKLVALLALCTVSFIVGYLARPDKVELIMTPNPNQQECTVVVVDGRYPADLYFPRFDPTRADSVHDARVPDGG